MCERWSKRLHSKDGDERVDFEDAEEVSVVTWRWFGCG